MSQEEKELALGLGLTCVGVGLLVLAAAKAPQATGVFLLGCTGWCIGGMASWSAQKIIRRGQ